MNVLLRLSPDLVYGRDSKTIELLGDRIGLSIPDINDAVISWLEYSHYNCDTEYAIQDVVDTCFMGDPMGRDILYNVTYRRGEILTYLPDATTSFRYARQQGDGIYILCEVEHADTPNIRFDAVHESNY